MTESPFKYELGHFAQDVVTQFKGTISSRADYLDEDNRYGLEPIVTTKNSNPSIKWFPESRIIIIPRKSTRKKRVIKKK